MVESIEMNIGVKLENIVEVEVIDKRQQRRMGFSPCGLLNQASG